jgi:DNA polymerase III alpha subunit
VEGLKRLKYHVLNDIKQTVHTRRRADLIDGAITALLTPPYTLTDLPSWRAKQERELLGIELTCHELDEYDTSHANCTCREYIKGFQSKYIAIAAQLDYVRKWNVKSGKNKGAEMAFMRINDGTCCLDNVAVFSDTWIKLKKTLREGQILLLRGTRDENRGSFLVKRAEKLTHCI